jgi:hypothetical protein
MKSFTKTTITTYTPLWVNLDFSKFTVGFKDIRKHYTYKGYNCFKCDKDFDLNEPISLACFEDIGNKLLCVDCGKELLNEC